MGGSVNAIEAGFIQNEIARASYEYQKSIENKERIIVGVNQFTMEEPAFDKIFMISDSIRQLQIEKINALKNSRDNAKVKAVIARVEETAKTGANLMPVIIEAVESHCTLGEIADAMRRVFGEYA